MNILGQLISMSLVIHIIIIVGKKMRKIFPFMRRRRIRVTEKKFLSAFIITFVACVVSTVVVIIVVLCFIDSHSNFRIIAELVESAHIGHGAEYSVSGSGTVSESGETDAGLPSGISPCRGETGLSLDNLSIVNELVFQNNPHTFEARSSLAHKYHMDDYRGTAAQNLFLLSKIHGTGDALKNPCSTQGS